MHTTDILDFPLTASQNTAPEFAGRLATDAYGNLFQLCLVKGSTVAAKSGAPALWFSNDSTGYTVTPDWTQAMGNGSMSSAGMFMCTSLVASAVTAGTSYVWVLRQGNPGLAGVSTIATDGGVAANEVLMPSSNDGKWTGIATISVGSDATTHPVNNRYAGYTRVADNASSQIVAPAFVEITCFGRGA